jgi:phosphatidylglycerophosphate synthase
LEKGKEQKSKPRLLIDEVRDGLYEYHVGTRGYTKFKTNLYIELASPIVYFLQGTKIHPNVITLLYGLFGVMGGILLSFKHVFLGLTIFYLKGVLDWADGHYARITNQTSELGRKLDILCGIIGTLMLKCFGVKISRACVIDSIILIILVFALTTG